MTKLTLAAVNAMDKAAFVAAFGAVYEHSPWVAERAHGAKFERLTDLHAAMAQAVTQASTDEQLALLRAHPDLAGRAALAGNLTIASTLEQASAGLDQLTAGELARFTDANAAYQAKFGFPFILAVKHWTKAHVLAAFDGRQHHCFEQERATALTEVNKIGFSRLLDLVESAKTGRLTTHVLDTARGRPAAGMEIELSRIERDGRLTQLKRVATNADGRLDAPALSPDEIAVGRYQLAFAAGAYFLATGQPTSAPAFLDVVPLRFAIDNPEEHFHVPLLVSPWSYSTYRGS